MHAASVRLAEDDAGASVEVEFLEGGAAVLALGRHFAHADLVAHHLDGLRAANFLTAKKNNLLKLKTAGFAIQNLRICKFRDRSLTYCIMQDEFALCVCLIQNACNEIRQKERADCIIHFARERKQLGQIRINDAIAGNWHLMEMRLRCSLIHFDIKITHALSCYICCQALH